MTNYANNKENYERLSIRMRNCIAKTIGWKYACAVLLFGCSDNINRLMTVGMMSNDSFALKFVCIQLVWYVLCCCFFGVCCFWKMHTTKNLMRFVVVVMLFFGITVMSLHAQAKHTYESMIPLTGISIRKICNHMAHRRWSIHLTTGDTKRITTICHCSSLTGCCCLFWCCCCCCCNSFFCVLCIQLFRFGCCALYCVAFYTCLVFRIHDLTGNG